MAALIKAEADVKYKGAKGQTALQNAASACRAEIVKLLIEKGADVNAKLETGWTAAGMAHKEGHYETEALIREQGGK